MTNPNDPGNQNYGGNENFGNYGQWNDQNQQWQDPNQGAQNYGQVPGYPAAPNQSDDSTGFFKALFDLEFNHFVTIKFAKVIYLIIMIVIGIFAAFGVIAAIVAAVGAAQEGSGVAGFFIFLLMIIGVAVLSLLYLVGARISLEFYVAGIRTAQNTGQIRDNTRR